MKFFTAITLTLTLCIFTINLFAQTIYVDAGNTSGVEDGTQNHPFNTLEEGMNTAVSGKTLLIRNGNYTPAGGTFYIKPGIKLEGENQDLTVIIGDIKDTTNSSLAVKIEKLQFNDFIFRRPALINGNITETGDIKDCKCNNIKISHGGGFSDATKTEVGPIPYFNISGNVVQESVNFSFGVGLIVGENKVTNNKAGSIGLSHGSTVFTSTPPLPASGYRFENNEVSEEFFFNQGSGLNVPIIVRNNTAKSLSVRSGSGQTYTLTNNTLQNGYFDSSGANRTLFSGNTIVNGRISDSSGGWADGTEDAIIENNTIHYVYNIELGGEVVRVTSASVTLKNNTITGEGGVSGITINSGVPTNINGNKITLNNGIPVKNTYGINTSAGNGLVTGNEISGGWIGYYSRSGATLFDRNSIKNCHHGFYCKGAEEVTNNTITRCKGYGMILDGLRGPVSGNTITDNDSAGIWVIKTTDIGGGRTLGAGRNILRGNGYYDMRITINVVTPDTLFINNNVWDHETIADILKYDILNESTGGKLLLDFNSIIAKPSVVQLASPGNQAVLTSRPAQLVWQAVENSDNYRLQISTDEVFGTLLFDTLLAVVTFSPEDLSNQSDFYWRVQSVNLAGENGWSETWQFSTLITGLHETEIGKNGIVLYPNPTTGKFRVLSSAPIAIGVRVEIVEVVDLNGKVLENFEMLPETGNPEFDISHLNPGVYFCRIKTDRSVFISKIILK